LVLKFDQDERLQQVMGDLPSFVRVVLK